MSRGAPAYYDAEAEAAVIGACLVYRAALGTALDMLTAADFGAPSHRHIWQAIESLAATGTAVEPSTVANELRRLGLTEHVDMPQLATLAIDAPGAASVGRHAETVATHALRRRIVAEAHALAAKAEDLTVDPGDALDAHKARLEEIDSPVLGRSPGDELAEEFVERVRNQAPASWVVPDCITDDTRVAIVAPEGVGKMLRVDEPVPTPDGWTTMGALRVGDQVFGSDGQPCRVTWAGPVDPAPQAMRLTFSDGVSIEACVDHQWVTLDYQERQAKGRTPGIRTTKEIHDSLMARNGHVKNHAVPVAKPISPDKTILPVGPYTLGAWLGDGHSGSAALASADPEIIANIEADGYQVIPLGQKYAWYITTMEMADAKQQARQLWEDGVFTISAIARAVGVHRDTVRRWSVDGLWQRPPLRLAGPRPAPSAPTSFVSYLRALGVLNNKHIPFQYLRSSVEDRQALLAGICDTDGSIAKSSAHAAMCEITLCRKQLADDVLELVLSLGIKATMHESDATLNGRVIGRRWRITFQSPFNPFRLERKRTRWHPLRTSRAQLRYIVAAEPCPSSPMRCITVDSPDHTYLVSRHFVPTHNTELIRQILVCVAYGLHPFTFEPIPAQPTLLLDLENPEQNVAERVGALIELAKAQNRLGPRRGTADDIIWHRPTGIDLRKRSDRVAFEDVLRRRRPKLVGICPIYTAYTRAANESDEMVAQSVVAILNNLRKRYGFGLLLEMHAPHGEDLQHRVLRPIGSSLWMRWPELGRKLMPKDGEDPFMPQTVVLGRFRGDRLQVNWPDELRRGRDWPWMGEWTTKRPPKARAVRPNDQDEEPF